MSGPHFKDRVLQETTDTGTTAITLGSAVVGYQSFAAVGDGNTCHYCIYEVDANGNASGAWEIVRDASYTAAGTELSRGTLASSSTGSAINFGAGTKRVALIEFPAAHANQFCLLRNSANQSIPDITATAITFDTEISDLSAMHSTGADTSRVNIIVPGLYIVQGEVAFASNATGARASLIRKNGSIYLGGEKGPPTNGDLSQVQVTAVELFAATDYVELMVTQTSGGALDSVAASPWLPSLRVVRIGP